MKFLIGLTTLLALSFSAHAELSPEKQELKAEIINIATENTNNIDNRIEVRQVLDQKIAELTKGLPKVDEKRWAKFSPGSWKQVWADEQNNGDAPIAQNFDRIFQYVTSEGRAVNLGERIFPDGTRVTFALEAIGTVKGDTQNTKIVSGFSKTEGLYSGMSIEYLSQDILSQTLEIFTPAQLGTFPKGPINAESDLKFSFLDADLKVGTAPNVFTGESEMFVLIRQDYVR